MDIGEAEKIFLTISGVDNEEVDTYRPIIKNSFLYVNNLLKDGVDKKKNGNLIDFAVATYSYYRWCLFKEDNSVKSFKAGDVSISESTSGSSTNKAYELWKESLNSISHLITPQDFYFRGVDI